MIATKWEVLDQPDAPCADISFHWKSEQGAQFIVLMHFSRVVGGYAQDLKIVFQQPLAIQWEEESYGLIDLPIDLPRCLQAPFSTWTYPALTIEGSKWADLYAARIYSAEQFKTHKIRHFAFMAMNDLLHVLSEKEPYVEVVDAVAESR